jgi:hypothetical protein
MRGRNITGCLKVHLVKAKGDCPKSLYKSDAGARFGLRFRWSVAKKPLHLEPLQFNMVMSWDT